MSHKSRGGGGKRADIAVAKLEKRIAKRLKRKHGKPPLSVECNRLPSTCNTKTLKGNVYHSAAGGDGGSDFDAAEAGGQEHASVAWAAGVPLPALSDVAPGAGEGIQEGGREA